MNRFGWLFTVLLVLGVATIAYTAQTPPDPAEPAAVSAEEYIIPVKGVRASQLVDSWHDPRGDGTRAHEALDIPAPGGTPVLAAFSGIVTKIFTSSAGGLTVYVRDGDIQAYYAHLSGYAEGLREGQHVTAGQTIAFVGDTGNAGAGNTHLHFALNRMREGERWWQGEAFNPYPLLAGKRSSR
jgi:murein DD-endopeptidase MepM/ murein hydrolase activator NlpD